VYFGKLVFESDEQEFSEIKPWLLWLDVTWFIWYCWWVMTSFLPQECSGHFWWTCPTYGYGYAKRWVWLPEYRFPL